VPVTAKLVVMAVMLATVHRTRDIELGPSREDAKADGPGGIAAGVAFGVEERELRLRVERDLVPVGIRVCEHDAAAADRGEVEEAGNASGKVVPSRPLSEGRDAGRSVQAKGDLEDD
jgi:hypothetical protein